MMSLELMHLFQEKRYSELRKMLLNTSDIDDIDDPNLRDRLNLITARLELVEGNNKKGFACYEKLITPAFRAEYDSSKNKQD